MSTEHDYHDIPELQPNRWQPRRDDDFDFGELFVFALILAVGGFLLTLWFPGDIEAEQRMITDHQPPQVAARGQE